MKHDAVLSFVSLSEPLIAALEEIKFNGKGKRPVQANSLILAFLSPAFLISLHVAEHVLALTLPLSKKLQMRSIDMSAAIDDIEAVQQTIENNRNNANASFSKIFAHVQALAEKLNVEITSRQAGVWKQNFGSNAFESTEEYFRRALFIPFMDHVLAKLKQRFEKHSAFLKDFSVIVPSVMPPMQDDREKGAENLLTAFARRNEGCFGRTATMVDKVGKQSGKLAPQYRNRCPLSLRRQVLSECVQATPDSSHPSSDHCQHRERFQA